MGNKVSGKIPFSPYFSLLVPSDNLILHPHKLPMKGKGGDSKAEINPAAIEISKIEAFYFCQKTINNKV